MTRMFISILLCVLNAPLVSAATGGWGHWDDSGSAAGRWTDYAEYRPDAPGAWLVARLAGTRGDEMLLRDTGGAMVRWVATDDVVRLDAVRQHIEKAAELKVSLYLVRGDSPNASAGFREGKPVVLVNFAMFDMVGREGDLWAALLGHEIAHLKLAHGEKQAKRNVPLSVLKTVGKAVLAADPLASTAGGLLVDGIGATFSRAAEREADYMGVIWAIEADYRADGAARLHKRMISRSPGHPLPFLSSHPSGQERIESLEALAERLAPSDS